MKTKEELNALKEEVETLNKKLAELSEDEMAAVTGGLIPIIFASSPCEPKSSQRSENCSAGGAVAHPWDEASAGLITDPENSLP